MSLWPIDPPASDLAEPDHGSRCGCEGCARERHDLRYADAADRDREAALEDAGAESWDDDGDIDW